MVIQFKLGDRVMLASGRQKGFTGQIIGIWAPRDVDGNPYSFRIKLDEPYGRNRWYKEALRMDLAKVEACGCILFQDELAIHCAKHQTEGEKKLLREAVPLR